MIGTEGQPREPNSARFLATGNVYPEVERKFPHYANKTPRAVFRNLGNRTFEELVHEATHNWLKIKLYGEQSNRSAIGARVLVHYDGKSHAQTVLSQSSFYSCNDSRLRFGLGAHRAVDIDIHWPNGLHEQFKNIPANQFISFREGLGIVPSKGWPSPSPSTL